MGFWGFMWPLFNQVTIMVMSRIRNSWILPLVEAKQAFSWFKWQNFTMLIGVKYISHFLGNKNIGQLFSQNFWRIDFQRWMWKLSHKLRSPGRLRAHKIWFWHSKNENFQNFRFCLLDILMFGIIVYIHDLNYRQDLSFPWSKFKFQLIIQIVKIILLLSFSIFTVYLIFNLGRQRLDFRFEP